MDQEVYEVNLACSNCGHSQRDQILRGTEIATYTLFTRCNNCGCKCLERDTTIRFPGDLVDTNLKA